MNENHVDLNQINYLLGQEGISAERKTQLEALKAQYEALANQVNTIQESLANLTNNFNKAEEEIKLEREHERLSGLINHYTEINKTSLTDYEANFRRTMMKEDGSGLIQRLFACIEKEPRYATLPAYLEVKKEIEEAFKNPFDMKKFAKKQEEYIATREKYRELIAKDPNNYAELSQISTKLKRLQESIVTEANKYVFNKKKLETLYEKNIHQLASFGSYAINAERNAILNEIQKVYEPFHERFDSERRLKFYTQDLAKIEAQMAELGVKKAESKTASAATATPASSAEPESISKTATQGTPVTPASSVGTATNPTGTNPENDPETKDHSGLHFIGLPNDKYYDSVRDAYRYGDEIEIDKEEEIDGTTLITLKGSDVKIEKNLFATTADIEDEFKHAMKAHKTSTNHIKAGMKVTPCWPGHYNRAILKNSARGNEADIEVKNMKLHDEIEVEKVFYKGTRKFVKLVGYENAFSADSFAIAPSTIKEIAEKKEAAKKAKEELKAKKSKTGPENEQQATSRIYSSVPDVSQSTNLYEIAKVIQQLNPNAEIRVANIAYDPQATSRFYSSVPIGQLVLPEGFYANEKNGITNKHKTQSGMYCDLSVEDLSMADERTLLPKKPQVSEQQTLENEQQAQINEINEADPKFDPESIIQEVESYSPSNASENKTKDTKLKEIIGEDEYAKFIEIYDDVKDEKSKTPENEPVVEEQKQSVSDFLKEAENTAEKDAFFNAEDKAAFQASFDETYEQVHGKKAVTATEETPDKQTKQKARVGAIAGIANNERTPLRVRIASMWSLITSKTGKAVKGKFADIAQNIVDKAQAQGASEEELKEAKEMQAEAARQEGNAPVEKENQWII